MLESGLRGARGLCWNARKKGNCRDGIKIIHYKSAMIIGKCPHGIVGHLFGYMPRSGIAGSWGRTIPSFLRNHQIDFQRVCTSLYSNQQWRSVPLTPYPHQHVLSLKFWILAILVGIIWNFRVVWFIFPWWLRLMSLSASWIFEIPLLRFSVHFWNPFLNLLFRLLCLPSWFLCKFWI